MRLCRRRRSCQPEMSDHGCIHLNNFKAAKGIQPYKVIHSYFVTSTSTEARVRKAVSCLCHTCKTYKEPTFLSSLYIFWLLCKRSYTRACENEKTYPAVDLCYGNILCFQCGDYVYDRELLAVAKAQWSESAKSLSFGILSYMGTYSDRSGVAKKAPAPKTCRRKFHYRFKGTDQSREYLFRELHRTGTDSYSTITRLLPC